MTTAWTKRASSTTGIVAPTRATATTSDSASPWSGEFRYLCAFHHTAFDRHIFGIRPDLVVEVRKDILAETDGPMLRHGLQEIAGLRIVPPRASAHRPRQDLLEIRYAAFRKAS